MRFIFFWYAFFLTQFLFSSSSFAAQNDDTLPDSIIVHYKHANPHVKNDEFLKHDNKFEVIRHIDSIARSSDSKWQRLREKIKTIESKDDVVYAEPNYLGHFDSQVILRSSSQSNSAQWWLPAVSDKGIKDLGRGAGVIVAVIDTGVDLMHPDLKENILADGYNIGDDNNYPQDTLGHGTMMAGIIAASGSASGSGISSLAPEAKILPIKINKGNEDNFTSAHLASAIDYAVKHHAKVINLSLTVSNQTQTVRNTIQNALNQGVIIVASAGNQNRAVDFPANIPGVIAVAAVDKMNNLAFFSNFGPEIDIAAPGVDIFTTMLGSGYGSGTGTSYATPIVTAAIADLLSINATLPADIFIKYLRSQASTISDATYSFGSLNAGAAGRSLLPHISPNKETFNRSENIHISYQLPRTGAAVDIYVAVKTPLGEFSLLPDGNWFKVEKENYQPIRLGYENQEAVEGALFGYNGFFPSISISSLGLPAGTYVLRTALVLSATGKIIGDVSESLMHLD